MIDTYVINLDRDTVKWENIQKRFSWKITRVDAVDGNKCKRPFFVNRLMYGCLQSHRKVWEIVVESEKHALVLEDDCHPLGDFNESFSRLYNTLPADFDVAIIGYIGSDVRRDYLMTAMNAPIMKKRALKKVNDDWYVPGMFVGTHCYIISPEGAKKLLANKTIYHADAVISRDTSLNIYCPKETIASQGENGKILYNPYMSWEWILVEPVLGVGPWTVRGIHLFLLYIIVVVGLSMSRNTIMRLVAAVLVVAPIDHYFGIKAHVKHSILFNHTETNNKNKQDDEFYHKLNTMNDMVFMATQVIVLWIGVRNGILVPIIYIMLVATLLRSLVIDNTPPLKDPSGICEEKAISKLSLFEYCGSLQVSGHIMSAVVLTYFMPKLGIFFITLQTTLMLLSKSHYVPDIALGIIVMSIVFWIFNTIVFKKKLMCKIKQKCL